MRCELDYERLKSDIRVAVKIFSTLLVATNSIYIVIDGLDEIDEMERSIFVMHLLNTLKDCEVKILFSSRPEDDLKKLLSDRVESVRVDARNAGSIQAFVRQWTETWLQDRHFFPEHQSAIRRWLSPLASKAKGCSRSIVQSMAEC